MKTLQNHFTTPEQSRRLLELGLPADSADCYYLREYTDKVYLFNNQKESDNCISKIRLRLGLGHAMPCWSVGRLAEVFLICYTKEFEQMLTNRYIPRSFTEYWCECFHIGSVQEALDFSKLEG